MAKDKNTVKNLKRAKTKYIVRKYTDKELIGFFKLDDKESTKLKKDKLL